MFQFYGALSFTGERVTAAHCVPWVSSVLHTVFDGIAASHCVSGARNTASHYVVVRFNAAHSASGLRITAQCVSGLSSLLCPYSDPGEVYLYAVLLG